LIKIPPVGGDTMFSNMELAWDTLDEKIKEKIKKYYIVYWVLQLYEIIEV
jgi:alpha-ketoglutarate-dependent taurine dioxygenase|tara:strand:- start:225 stop:374 length:150 start_codon:yes stop_codon:yes gene_type:complete